MSSARLLLDMVRVAEQVRGAPDAEEIEVPADKATFDIMFSRHASKPTREAVRPSTGPDSCRAYKIFCRYKQMGLEALADRSWWSVALRQPAA